LGDSGCTKLSPSAAVSTADGRLPKVGGYRHVSADIVIRLCRDRSPANVAGTVSVMPLHYRIDSSQSLTYLIAADPLTFADWQVALDAVLADPRFKQGFGFISDRRQVVADKSMEDLPKMAGYLRQHAEQLGQCRWAVVVAPEAKLAHGWAVVASELVDGSTEIEPAVFTDVEAALAWVTKKA
jgi:hypothetical protein